MLGLALRPEASFHPYGKTPKLKEDPKSAASVHLAWQPLQGRNVQPSPTLAHRGFLTGWRRGGAGDSTATVTLNLSLGRGAISLRGPGSLLVAPRQDYQIPRAQCGRAWSKCQATAVIVVNHLTGCWFQSSSPRGPQTPCTGC